MTLALVALLVTVGMQLLRVLFPLAFDLSESAGSINAGLFVLAIFAAAPFVAALVRPVGRTQSRAALIGGTFAVRLAVQFVHPVPIWLATAGVVLFLAALTLEIHELRTRRAGASSLAVGILLGLSLDSALRTAFWTWDLAWQEGALPVALTVLLCAIGFFVLVADLRHASAETAGGAVRGVFALGPFLMLQVLFLQSPAFVASAAGAPLPAASALILAGNALAIARVTWLGSHRFPHPATIAAGAALVVDAALLRALEGPAIGAVVLIGAPLAAGFLLEGLVRRPGPPSGPWLTAAATSLTLETFLLLAFGYQVHYDLPLPFPNAWLPPIGALLLVGPVVLRGPSSERAPTGSWRLALAPLLLLLVPLGVALTRGSETRAGDGAVRIMGYNLHMAVTPDGQVDPEALARIIEEQDPDVVVLQEVARGWVTNGMTDLAEWMSARLEMPYVYGPAADGQFGNAVLSRLPIVGSGQGRLGRFESTMDRGWVRVEIAAGPGTDPATVIGTHLAHLPEDGPTRLQQIDVLLQDAWRGDAPVVIAADMNAEPDSAEIELLTERAGLLSAQDEAGMGALPTYWPDGTRIDYVFVTPDLAISDLVRPYAEVSDHLPLAVTIRVT